MKYNTKIKNLFLLIFIATSFCLSTGKVSAAMEECFSYDGAKGTCQAWCSDPLIKDIQGSIDCADANWFENSCCIPGNTAINIGEPTTNPDSITTCSRIDGEIKGNCEFGECSPGLVPIQSNDCWLGRTCCGLAVSSIGTPSPSIKWCASIDGKETGKCVVGATCTAKEIESNDCPGGLCCGDSQGSSSYQAPSLITCNGGAGLCYGNGCPEGSSKLEDTNSDCGWANSCCSKTDSASCGSGGLCVDSGVICTDVISGDCNSGQKCCSVKVPVAKTVAPTTATTPANYGSQCDDNNKNCKTENDQAILENQCKVLFNPDNCSSMNVYLNYLNYQCERMDPPGIDCALITSAGYYGNEASKFANYYINANNGGAPGSTGQSAGGLDFDEIARTGIPDSPGGIKPILVNLAKWMLEIIGIIALIAFIISGGQYLLAAGDEKMLETAKRNLTYSIIGVIVALSGFVVIRAIDTALRASSTLF